jgi:hypothetical protein
MIGTKKKETLKVLSMFLNLDMVPSIITYLTMNTSKTSTTTQFLTMLVKLIQNYLKMKEVLIVDWLSILPPYLLEIPFLLMITN